MSRFGNLKQAKPQPSIQATPVPAAPEQDEPQVRRSPIAKAREGKKPVQGYFSEELSRELRLMSIKEGTTVQALLGEAIDLLMTARGQNRFGER